MEFSVYSCLVRPVWNLPCHSFIDITYSTLHSIHFAFVVPIGQSVLLDNELQLVSVKCTLVIFSGIVFCITFFVTD